MWQAAKHKGEETISLGLTVIVGFAHAQQQLQRIFSFDKSTPLSLSWEGDSHVWAQPESGRWFTLQQPLQHRPQLLGAKVVTDIWDGF